MTLFFIIVLIIVLFIINKLFLNKQNFKFKLIFSIVTSIFFIVICSLLFVYLWNSGTGGQPTEPTTKKIYFNNVNKRRCIVVVDFKYSNKDILNNPSIDITYNTIDTVYLGIGKQEFFKTLISYLDTINFPENFKIKIIDSFGKTIKTYSKETFFNSIEKSTYTNLSDVERKEASWNLIIK
ncbi:hypothetical protein HNQ02_003701 [Flavobacterium sp. 7E]|uniref:hypothetical protein n=1 Tax=Flavobacterium sp. 7E TaxID=2735898 RepID=UPI001570A6E0|nr:hypothetical protein [Flavobacterium sp. 7E]NRS90754.1 hypothetical protein [Flavobacterium sp. 7E]